MLLIPEYHTNLFQRIFWRDYHLVQIHLKDTLKVSDTCPGKFRDLVIGEGQVDFLPIFKTLKAIDYQGPFVIEMWAQDDNWKENIISARQRLLDTAAQAGYGLQN